jgi:hypothetical protein
VSTEKYALVLIGDQVACFESTTLSDAQWKSTFIDGEPWVSLSSHSAHTVGTVLKQLSDRRNLREQLAQVPITVIYDRAGAHHLADVSKAFFQLHCCTWEVLRYEPMAERVRLTTGECLPQQVGNWLVEHLLVQLGSTLPVTEPVSASSSNARNFSALPDVALLQLYLPLLFQNFWSSVSPQDLAFMSGSLQVPDVESPYPEPSQEAIAVLRRRFMRLPVDQRSMVLAFAQELAHKLKIRAQLRDLLEVF